MLCYSNSTQADHLEITTDGCNTARTNTRGEYIWVSLYSINRLWFLVKSLCLSTFFRITNIWRFVKLNPHFVSIKFFPYFDHYIPLYSIHLTCSFSLKSLAFPSTPAAPFGNRLPWARRSTYSHSVSKRTRFLPYSWRSHQSRWYVVQLRTYPRQRKHPSKDSFFSFFIIPWYHQGQCNRRRWGGC